MTSRDVVAFAMGMAFLGLLVIISEIGAAGL
jgi:hypothetical protein